MENKEVIIGGVNVAGCEYCLKMTKYRCTIQRDVYKCLCEENPNCHYKQLAREKQKLRKIKEIIEIHKDSKCAICPKFDECFDHPSCDNVILQIIDSKRG